MNEHIKDFYFNYIYEFYNKIPIIKYKDRLFSLVYE